MASTTPFVTYWLAQSNGRHFGLRRSREALSQRFSMNW